MNGKILSIIDDDYQRWVTALKKRYRQSQIKAAVKVNSELVFFNWSLGRDIATMKPEMKWGEGFYNALSKDLRESIPDAKGFSPRNLHYMRRFYELFPSLGDSQQTNDQMGKARLRNETKSRHKPWRKSFPFRGGTSASSSTMPERIKRRRSFM